MDLNKARFIRLSPRFSGILCSLFACFLPLYLPKVLFNGTTLSLLMAFWHSPIRLSSIIQSHSTINLPHYPLSYKSIIQPNLTQSMASSSVKKIQLQFGYPSYPGKANVRHGLAGYYGLRNYVRYWVHYNGLFTTNIIVHSESWDALVPSIIDDPDFPQPAVGAVPTFSRSSSPSA